MLESATILEPVSAPSAQTTCLDVVRQIANRDLSPLVQAIDADGVYPEQVMHALGEAGAFAAHAGPSPDLKSAIQAMSRISEICLSTAFCMWCQNALAWYIANSANEELKATLGPRVSSGEVLGGTALSNPMKTFFGIETLKLKATRVDGGYVVRGLLPWVSNLGDDHYFGAIFELSDNPGHRVMAVIDCAHPDVTIRQNDHFVALEGTRTFAIQIRDAFIPDAMVLADPIDSYLPRIRAGFILLQAGMAFGLIRNCIDLMKQTRSTLGHVNKYLERQPEDFEAELAGMEAEVFTLCETPYDPSPAYFRRVVEARLAAGEASVSAAHYAMLHCGARGYVATGAAQRRLREAYFVAIVTPATKQLRKMLAEMPNQ
jgi:hypothetical protein